MGRIERVLFVLACVGLVALTGWVMEGKLADSAHARGATVEDGTASKPTAPLASSTTSTTAPNQIRRRSYDLGDCVDYDENDRIATSHVIPCDEPRVFEVVSDMVAKVDLPGDAPYPNDAEWRMWWEQLCRADAVAYLDGRLDPSGRLVVGGVTPTRSRRRSQPERGRHEGRGAIRMGQWPLADRGPEPLGWRHGRLPGPRDPLARGRCDRRRDAEPVAAVSAILLMALALAAIVHRTETRVRRLEPDAILLLVAYAGALYAVWSVSA